MAKIQWKVKFFFPKLEGQRKSMTVEEPLANYPTVSFADTALNIVYSFTVSVKKCI